MGIPRHSAGWLVYLAVKGRVVEWALTAPTLAPYIRQFGVISGLGKERGTSIT